jgi:hypothetical protein
MKNPELNDAEIHRLIASRIAADDADSGWVVAWTMLRVLPVLNEIAQGLEAINAAIAPNNVNAPAVSTVLAAIQRTLEK